MTADLGVTSVTVPFGDNALPKPPPRPWQKIWEGARPGDRDERFWLYQRIEPLKPVIDKDAEEPKPGTDKPDVPDLKDKTEAAKPKP